ncbi:MAG: hypothetical protein NC548_35465 [Lachnospiraceae bacterium]|nr:hypothetical protein [Lachnospiraceae bacterium]
MKELKYHLPEPQKVGEFYPEAKVYFDGSHYIAIPHTTKPYKPRPKKKEEVITVKPPAVKDSEKTKKEDSAPPLDDALLPLEKIAMTGELPSEEEPKNIIQPNERRMTKKELFNELYRKYLYEKKAVRREKLIAAMRLYFKTEKAAEIYVDCNLERKKRNLIARRIRLTRKVNLQDFNFFVTFTYSDKLHTEESFKKGIKSTLKNFSSRKGWRYVGVWERSPEKRRLHFHGLFHIPEGTLPSELDEREDYSFATHRRQTIHECTYFAYRFGRNDFEPIDDTDKLRNAIAYLMKYLEKTGEKIVYSKGLPQYFISDIVEDDVVSRIGMEDKKLLLFDDFTCWDEGEYIGTVNKTVIDKLRKSN